MILSAVNYLPGDKTCRFLTIIHPHLLFHAPLDDGAPVAALELVKSLVSVTLALTCNIAFSAKMVKTHDKNMKMALDLSLLCPS